MAGSRFPSKVFLFLSKLVMRTLPRTSSYNSSYPTRNNMEKSISHPVLIKSEELSNDDILVFDFEGAVLRSPSLFPYFMLVAFEAGGFLRSLLLLLSYPLVWVLGEKQNMGLKIMVFLSFFGIKKESFRIGASVLPKFFLEDVGCEGFEGVMSFERKVGTSMMPRVMVENFMKEYLGAECVVAAELKSFCGYFLGVVEDINSHTDDHLLVQLKEKKLVTHTHNVIGITSPKNYVDHRRVFSHCKEAYLVRDAEKRKWGVLPRDRYPKPLIFHDGRLALRPTPWCCVAMLMWLPLGLCICLMRIILGVLLPFKTSAPILAFSGTRTTVQYHQHHSYYKPPKEKGMLYVCNHRTLVDPLYVSYALDQPVSTVTYSLSRFNELLAPIRTIRLKRDREEDRKRMEQLLRQGNLVVCPEGTTCREPFLLRFSPLFAELTHDIVPVALDVKANMFYGTTASGHKCLDPVFHFLNPTPSYSIQFLQRIDKSSTCQAGGKSRIEVANHVQSEIGKALGFVCTSFTRKDKYMILAGNEGIASSHSGKPTSTTPLHYSSSTCMCH